ncbi:MAG: hypothetical protein WEC83_00860 [Patescibacteria group bacterium]
MLQLKRSKGGAYELSDKKQAIELIGKTVKVGEETVESPGEYEQGGLEIVYATNAALLVWDHMQICYLFSLAAPDDFEKNQLSSADIILLSDEIETCSKEQLTGLIGAYDPRSVIISGKTNLDAGYRDIIKPIEQTTIKLAANLLPVEGRDFYILP